MLQKSQHIGERIGNEHHIDEGDRPAERAKKNGRTQNGRPPTCSFTAESSAQPTGTRPRATSRRIDVRRNRAFGSLSPVSFAVSKPQVNTTWVFPRGIPDKDPMTAKSSISPHIKRAEPSHPSRNQPDRAGRSPTSSRDRTSRRRRPLPRSSRPPRHPLHEGLDGFDAQLVGHLLRLRAIASSLREPSRAVHALPSAKVRFGCWGIILHTWEGDA